VALSSCSSSTAFIPKATLVCPPKDIYERTDEVLALCRKAGLDSVKVEVQGRMSKIYATKPLWISPAGAGVYIRERGWTMYVRRDSVIAFAAQYTLEDGDWWVGPFYHDTTSSEESWYWVVRDELEKLCGANIVFALEDPPRHFDQYYRDLMDTSAAGGAFPLIALLQRAPIDSSDAAKNISQYQKSRVPFDTARSIWELDATILRNRLHFPPPVYIDRIRLFQTADESYLLDVRKHGMDKSIQRYILSAGDVEAMQKFIAITDERRTMRLEGVFFEQTMSRASGIPVLGTMLLSACSYIAPAGLLGVSPFSPILMLPGVVGVLGASAISIGAFQEPWFTMSAFVAMNDGMTWGLPQGFSLYSLIADETKPDFFAMYAVGIGASLLKAGLTMRVPDLLGLNLAQTFTVQSLASSGTALGMFLPAAFGAGLEQSQDPFPLRLYGASTLGLSALGHGLGYLLATNPARPMTGGNGYILDVLPKLGLFMPISLGIMLNAQSPLQSTQIRDLALASVVGQVLGYGLSGAILLEHDFTYTEGQVVRAASILGAAVPLTAISLFLRFSSEVQVRATLPYIPTVAVVGYGVGFLVGLLATERDSHQHFQENSRAKQSIAAAHKGTWLEDIAAKTQFDFSPLGLLGLATPNILPLGVSMPILSVQYKL
jgi:hypothetical protein